MLTQDNLFPHLSGRPDAYVFPPNIQDPETWHRAIDNTLSLRPDYIVMDLATDPHGTAVYGFLLVKMNKTYRLHSHQGQLYIYKNQPDSTEAQEPATGGPPE